MLAHYVAKPEMPILRVDNAVQLRTLTKNIGFSQLGEFFPILTENISGIAFVHAFEHMYAKRRKSEYDVSRESSISDSNKFVRIAGYSL